MMARLTHERCSGIKSGYWSPAKKDELIQRLGQIEELGPNLCARICCGICKHRELLSQEELHSKCDMCPLCKLERLIAGLEV